MLMLSNYKTCIELLKGRKDLKDFEIKMLLLLTEMLFSMQLQIRVYFKGFSASWEKTHPNVKFFTLMNDFFVDYIWQPPSAGLFIFDRMMLSYMIFKTLSKHFLVTNGAFDV